MNIILFEPEEIERPLPLRDLRAEHVVGVLRRKIGDAFDAGIVNGAKGKAWIVSSGEDGLQLAFRPESEEPPLPEIDVIVGLTRPQTCRKMLQELTTIGVRSIRFVTTDRSEPSYAQSKLWTTGEWRRHLVDGAAQAFSTRIPCVAFGGPLSEAIAAPPPGSRRIALDNYEATADLPLALSGASSVTLAIGSERGWTAPERRLLAESGFLLARLGARVLRTETAAALAVGLAGLLAQT